MKYTLNKNLIIEKKRTKSAKGAFILSPHKKVKKIEFLEILKMCRLLFLRPRCKKKIYFL